MGIETIIFSIFAILIIISGVLFIIKITSDLDNSISALRDFSPKEEKERKKTREFYDQIESELNNSIELNEEDIKQNLPEGCFYIESSDRKDH